MSLEGQPIYPGADATALDILALATEYHRSADAVLSTGRRGSRLSRYPHRLLAIQAIELYLNAFLLLHHVPSEKIRSLQHCLDVRSSLAAGRGLKLRKLTMKHLKDLSTAREYLVSRYQPGSNAKLSELNRLQATLSEVAKKVTAAIELERGQ